MISGHPGSLGWLIFGKKGQTTMSKNLVIGLKKPYLFEDEEYAAIDLSGMENLTMQDAIEAQKNVVGTGEDSVILYAPEASQAFIDEIAAMAAKQPVEFFNGMPIGLSDKVRTAVQGVFSADGNKAKDRVVTLDKPYTYDGNWAMSRHMRWCGRKALAALLKSWVSILAATRQGLRRSSPCVT